MKNASLRSMRALKEILYGMAIHDQVRALTRQRGSLEHLFVLISFGDLLGVPILPLFETEIRGAEMLKRTAALLFG